MKNRKTIFLYSNELEKYPYPADFPFKIERALKLRNALKSIGLLGGTETPEVDFGRAEPKTVELVHTTRYLEILQSSATGGWDIDALRMGIGGPDTPVFAGMYDYGMLACGATIKGADLVLSGEADVVFNPSGGFHHAMAERAAGFCYINDVAIASLYLADQGKKVLYLDVDVHHGDGVQQACFDRDDIMTISIHESGRYLFPGTGATEELGQGEGYGYSVNIPLPPETYNGAYMRCFREIVVPLVECYDADVVVFELGADALAGDPLAHLGLTNDVYVKILNYLLKLNKPLLMTGGGGYHVENTVRAWSLAWSVVTGAQTSISDMNIGLGGVMLESTDWLGGLQDRELPVTGEQKNQVDPVIDRTIRQIKELVFPTHGLKAN